MIATLFHRDFLFTLKIDKYIYKYKIYTLDLLKKLDCIECVILHVTISLQWLLVHTNSQHITIAGTKVSHSNAKCNVWVKYLAESTTETCDLLYHESM